MTIINLTFDFDIVRKALVTLMKLVDVAYTKSSNICDNMLVNDRVSVFTMVLQFLYRILVISVRFLVVRIYGRHGQVVSPVDDPLLLESATSIAHKIRTKEVSGSQCTQRSKQHVRNDL